MRRLLGLVTLVLLCSCLTFAQSAPTATPTAAPAAPAAPAAAAVPPLVEAERLYRDLKYADALRSYEQALKQDPKSAAAYEGAVRACLKLDLVQQAWTTAQEGLKQAPEQSLTHSAMGEALFRKGKIEDAQREFVTAYNMNEHDARAPYGLYRVYHSASYYAHARQMLETAHVTDPQDPDIHRAWMIYRPRPERIAEMERTLANETDPKQRAFTEKFIDLLKAEEKNPHGCKLATNVTETQVSLRVLMPNPQTMEGVQIKVVINDKPLNLLLDTGASGILLKNGAATAAGVVPAIETRIRGIGDEGALKGYVGFADTIGIGALQFQKCIVDVAESRNKQGREVMQNFDGLIGADVFSSYWISIDFPAEKMTLKPLPRIPGDQTAVTSLISAGELSSEDDAPTHDRYVAPEMRNYTPFFRFGHQMLIPTKIGETEPKLFIIDSGAMSSFISPAAAREVTSLGYDLDLRVGGLGGKVETASRAKYAVLRFGRVAQENRNMIAFDTAPISRSVGVDVAGLLGYTALGFMQVDLDYRDGLVNFSYDPKKYRPMMRWKQQGKEQ